MSQNAPAYSFFCNRACEFFPCHPVCDPEQFNCMFCYCPLYCLGDSCGGRFTYTAQGIKDCSMCTLPHTPGGYQHIIEKFPEIVAAMKREGE